MGGLKKNGKGRLDERGRVVYLRNRRVSESGLENLSVNEGKKG